MDLGMHKTFKLTESVNLRFSMDAQNLSNHPNFDGVDGKLKQRHLLAKQSSLSERGHA